MFDFLNNPWETDEQKRQKLNNSQTQAPFNGQQTQMTPRQMVEQAWDQSVAKQEAKEQAYKPMESMSTHDAVKYAWNKSLAEQEKKNTENSVPYLNRHRERLCSPDFEGNYDYPYLDTATPPKATIGCGINITDTPNIQLQNRHTGVDFSKTEQQAQLNQLYANYRPNHKASFYRDKTDIGISPSEHEKILRQKYEDAYQNIKNNYQNFDNFTPEQQDALLDMNYNLGTPKFNQYKLMRNAVNTGKWNEAAKQSYRPGISQVRNDWTASSLDPEWEKRRR